MSKKSDEFERSIVELVDKNKGTCIPKNIPDWMKREGIVGGAKIIGVEGIGSKDKQNKTDVIIYLENSEPIKISAKLSNADYFGNWYGHKRFLIEFGKQAFDRMTKAAAKWANEWSKTAKAPYVGVSICFGRRKGKTGVSFTSIFTQQDILTVAKGFGNGISVANCMYIKDKESNDIQSLISNLQEISIQNITKATEEFKVAFRPINPITEYTNRGKNVYTQFVPNKKMYKPTIIKDSQELFKLGSFKIVNPDCTNHNHILDNLEKNYNIIIPRKVKEK